MKILLFGGSGQLGFELLKRVQDLHFELLAPVTSEVDITHPIQVLNFVERVRPNIIVNAAAYTAVDRAEQEVEKAYALNRDGARNVAEAALRCHARLIHVSTDYVFDGTTQVALAEDAPTNPINVYGESKLAGERAVHDVLQGKELIVRTSSLHGKRGINFVHTMIDLFSNKEVVQVVNDQFMSPTWAGWLAETLLDLARTECSGILHASGSGVVSWYQFAKKIHEIVAPKLKNAARLEPTSSQQFVRPARRPGYSAMDCSRLSKLLGREPISWEDGLRYHLLELGYK